MQLNADALVLRAEIVVLLAMDAIESVPPAKLKSVLQPILHHTQEKRWALANLGSACRESGPLQDPV